METIEEGETIQGRKLFAERRYLQHLQEFPSTLPFQGLLWTAPHQNFRNHLVKASDKFENSSSQLV